ncbi:replication initiation protein RepC [Rhizobium sp. P38BS-XIX]|uniref:plasmid replication protein RepC n=1 Tax=Rhizobium sp. P38BS-XIX TaxID=2726740 RepID=UPI0014574EC9|nr:plasmid replication protein RepC [Rhizobium sp. P38BS-XIX]NLR97077.1 replication initiation protein RepC [Rhizobium sp. P38BS-XIX]
MDVACVTTPFGRRSMTFASLKKQRQAQMAVPDIKRNKWKLFRAVCEARNHLNVTDRSLTVLDALLSFYPADELCVANGVIVFPSNAQLSIRARGMTAATLRRHLSALIDAGLILRKDSANGKRFARRSRAGEINEAFGFSLAPLLSRAHEIETIAAQNATDRQLLLSAREKITLYRRDITKLIQLALNGNVSGNWNELNDRFRTILATLSRRPTLDEAQNFLIKMSELRSTIINLLDLHEKTQDMCAIESQNERHIQDSQTQSSFESETVAEPQKRNLISTSGIDRNEDNQSDIRQTAETAHNSGSRLNPNVALDTVLRACREVHPYGPGGSIRTWRDLLAATSVVRLILNISPSAFNEASAIMGPENAGIAIACILERATHINSAGAYLRDLSRRAVKQQFSVRPMVSALLKAKSTHSLSDQHTATGQVRYATASPARNEEQRCE